MTRNYLDILAETIRSNWDHPALTDFYLTEDGSAQDTSRGNHYTYGEMYAEICRVAKLLTSLGLQKGDHIAICGANSAHWCIAYLAIAKMQGVSVTVMHSLMPDEIARLINFSDAKALFTDEDIWAELKSQSMPQLESVIGLENWQIQKGKMQIISLPFREELEVCCPSFPQSEPDDLAMICFTSGTSGKAKGVMLSCRNIGNNLLHIWKGYDISEDNNIFSLLPLAHMFGFINDFLGQITLKKHLYFNKNISSIHGVYKCINLVRPYAITTIPSFIIELNNQYGQSLYEHLHEYCQLIALGGSHLPTEIEKKLLQYGLPVSVGYGLTETGPAISGNTFRENKSLSCGRIVVGMTARISPVGEILVKGENVMLGYYKDPEATAAKIDADGWLHTGDKGHLDEDGYLYVEGRLEQDIIVLPNGENIRPDNIESLINALPEVSESIVLARDGKLVAIVVPDSQMSNHKSQITNTDLRRKILRAVNPSLPLFSQLYDVEITDTPLARTEKQTIKRYLYS